RQIVVYDACVDELRRSALGRYHVPEKQRPLRRHVVERAVRVEDEIGPVVLPAGRVLGQQVAVGVEVRRIVKLASEAPLLAADAEQRRQLERAEGPAEADVLLVVELLVANGEDRVLRDILLEKVPDLRRDLEAQVRAADLGCEERVQRLDFHIQYSSARAARTNRRA